MRPRLSVNARLALASTFGTLAVLTIGFEAYEWWRYAAWRADYEKTADWRETLTVASANERLIWEYRANGAYAPLDIRTNAHGFRGSDGVTVAKPAGVYRIAFVGDSATLGMFVAEDRTFVRRFEALANQAVTGARIEALNFGVDGYNARQIAELMRTRVVAFTPDKVVYAMHLNDFDYEDSSGQKIRYFRRPASFVVDRLRRFYDEAVLGKSAIDYHLFHYRRRKAEVLGEVDAMRALAATRGIDFQVVVLPLLGRSFRDYDFRVMHDEIGGALAERGINYVDLLEPFRQQNAAPIFFAHDMWHPNARGHALIAERLVTPVLGARFEGARRFRVAREWRSAGAEQLRLDVSALGGIAVTEARQRRDAGHVVAERLVLDGGKGILLAEFLPDALLDPALAAALSRKETLIAKFREASARMRLPVRIEELVGLAADRSAGGYVRYGVAKAGLICVFAYTGFMLGDAGRFKMRGYDTLVLLNYCDKANREETIERFLRGLAVRPTVPAATGPAR